MIGTAMTSQRNRLFVFGIVLAMLIVAVVFSSQIFPYSNRLDMDHTLSPPNLAHFFGTDNLGRDLLARTFNGLRVSLALALIIQMISFAAGAVIGIVAGYFGGIIDRLYIIIQDVLMSFPSIVAALCLIVMIGSGMGTLVLALSILGWVRYARLIRSEVFTLKGYDYIMGAKAIGASNLYILCRHILPNVIRPVIPMFTLRIGHSVLAISTLGFLGFGVQPPTAEIGMMIKDGVTYITRAPWMLIFPGALLSLYVLCVNILGDELQAWFDHERAIAVI